MGRLTRDPDIRYTQGDNPTCIARYTLAVDRRFRRNGNNNGNNNDGDTADFIPCVCFGKSAEFVERYLKKGTKMAVTGRIQTGSYTNRDGAKVYTTEVVVEDQEFAESKSASGGGNGGYNGNGQPGGYQQQGGGQNYGGNQQTPRYNNQQPPQYGNQQGQQGQQYGGNYGGQQQGYDNLDGFMNIPDGIDEQLPFA